MYMGDSQRLSPYGRVKPQAYGGRKIRHFIYLKKILDNLNYVWYNIVKERRCHYVSTKPKSNYKMGQ